MTTEVEKLTNILGITRLQLSHALARAAELEATLMEKPQGCECKEE
jgi:hypothetical protein